MAQNNRSKKKKGFPWALVIIAIGLISQLAEGGGGSSSRIAVGLIGVVLGVVIIIAAIKAVIEVKNRSEAAAKSAPQRAYSPEVAARRPDPRSKSFTAPDPHCVVCENTGDDHFVRDRQQRIAQLDEWLKNGLIDKDEYRVLKYRFERDQ